MSSLARSEQRSPTRPRWLLLGSLALNLFFIGIAGSIAVRQWIEPPPATLDRSDAARIGRIAATLPPDDAERLRTQFAQQRQAVEAARETIRRKQDDIRAALRAEPFDVAAMRAAMTETRAARETFYQTLQSVVATAASQMTPAGRNKLADWRPPPRS